MSGSHRVIVLDDQSRSAQATTDIVRLWDPDAKVKIVRTEDEALSLVRGQSADDIEIAYIVAELLLEASPSNKQGKDFILMLLQNERTRSIPVLALSAYPLMIHELIDALTELYHAIPPTIHIVNRTSNLSVMYDSLQLFIAAAQEEFERTRIMA